MSLYNIKFFKEGLLLFETNVNHTFVSKALLYAEGEMINKISAADYDEVKILEIEKIEPK